MLQGIPHCTARCLSFWLSLCLLAGAFAPPALAQFISGSTGANGAFPPIATPMGTTEIELNLSNGQVTFQPGGSTVTLPGAPGGGFADGVLHFTRVGVPAGVTWRFPSAIVPLTILATGDVNIDGTIDLNGGDGGGPGISVGGRGGPGGFKGGQGILVAGGRAGAGLGPGGGGGGGLRNADNRLGGGGGGFALAGGSDSSTQIAGGGIYGISALLPLIGGSGGGGSCRTAGQPSGSGGGGGGGAMLVASSTTLSVTGVIQANGGVGGNNGGGGGSGGGIRLIASTLTGNGQILANGGAGGVNSSCFAGGAGGAGRIRLEAFTNNFTGTTSGNPSGGVPGIVFLPNMLTVRIESVGGTMVAPFPTGAAGGVDVVIPAPGDVTVMLKASRVPLGTTIAVTAKPETDADVIGPVLSPALAGTFDDSTASVNVTFPSAGVYFLEARATFMVPL